MSCTPARIIKVRSDSTEKRSPAGTHRLSSGRRVWIRSTVSITLASDCLVIVIRTAGSLLNQAAERALRVLSSMVAIDESRTAVPFGDLTTMSR